MVVRSMALYGAPIWAEALDAPNRALLRRPQRIVAVRACMAYRTVGHAAACALAGTPPWEVEAGVLAEAYRERAELRARGESLAPEELARSRARRKRTTLELWDNSLAGAEYGARTIEAIRPQLSDWCGRRHGALNYRLSQILTGHGCFGRYLHRIQREERMSCHECGADEDTAQHTLQVCSAWSEERRTLAAAIGDDLSLPGVIRAMLGSEGSWEAVSSFCEIAVREGDAPAAVAGMELDEEMLLSGSSRGASPSTRKRKARPPNSRSYAGMGKAKHLYIEAEQSDEGQSREEAEVVAASLAAKAQARANPMLRMVSDEEEEEDFQAAGTLSKIIEDNVEVIKKVASTSKNLKGGYVRALRDAAEGIIKTTKALKNRCTTEETRGLQAANSRLQAEVEQLRKEVAEMKQCLLAQHQRPEPAPRSDNEELVRTILCQVGTMVNARFEALEDRLLPEKRIRPPLASDSRPEPAGRRVPKAAGQDKRGQAPTKATGQVLSRPAVDGTVEPSAVPQDAAVEPRGQQRPTEMPWSEVVRRGQRGGKKKANRVRTDANAERRRAPRTHTIREPKSAAVVVSITPEGIAKGLSYDSVIAEAKSKIRLQDVGITTGVRFRICATGARRFEVIGEGNGPQADALAARLTQIFDGALVRITRPAKTTEVKVSGFDDSATVEEVLIAVAGAGGCAKESLRCTGFVRDRFGVYHAWIECPVATAKRVATAGRLLMSWASATVRLLEPRPLRCYRCLQKGHVRAQCTAEVDRSNQCFRCGVDGHKFKDCTAKPHCTICAAAKKPADHRLGGRGCSAPAPKVSRGIRPPVPPHQPIREDSMETDNPDLLVQSVAEWSIQLAVVSEPYFAPEGDTWLSDKDEVVALFVPRSPSSLSFGGVRRGRGYVSATVAGTLVVGVYCAPSWSLVDFESLLDQVGALIRRGPRHVVVMGDFNARSSAWGDVVTNPRGAVLEEWALTTGLTVLNRGSRPTCVRPQGNSVVDISFACPATARRVYGWEVVEGVETLSDHLYIRFQISDSTSAPVHQGAQSPHRDTPRWVVRRLNRDLLKEAALVETWSPADTSLGVDDRAEELCASMSR
ncbi:PREDICTED: uncharacterized protein LOC106121832, partial [Papilio xuthus]|uniref:Uncharacterized protein LOC106121832 n=1 Tax=Papilio xuthus TaxID=66420 RepID=A0AAJ6ZID1_PAPXU